MNFQSQSCEQKNEVLKNALHRLAKEKMAISDCGTCFADVLSAATDCTDGAWLQCIEDILGAGNPCVSCVCELVSDICGLLGCDWSC